MSAKSKPMRLPNEVVASARRVAAMKGVTVGQALLEAWKFWLAENGDRVAADLAVLAESLRQRSGRA